MGRGEYDDGDGQMNSSVVPVNVQASKQGFQRRPACLACVDK